MSNFVNEWHDFFSFMMRRLVCLLLTILHPLFSCQLVLPFSLMKPFLCSFRTFFSVHSFFFSVVSVSKKLLVASLLSLCSASWFLVVVFFHPFSVLVGLELHYLDLSLILLVQKNKGNICSGNQFD